MHGDLEPPGPDGKGVKPEEGGNQGATFLVFATLHFVCCGLPLLLFSGVSLAFLAPYWPVAAGIFAMLGGIGFVWYIRRGCATCPRNEGRCSARLKT
jgi:hypothetical protein